MFLEEHGKLFYRTTQASTTRCADRTGQPQPASVLSVALNANGTLYVGF
jgi:hypothetical protein